MDGFGREPVPVERLARLHEDPVPDNDRDTDGDHHEHVLRRATSHERRVDQTADEKRRHGAGDTACGEREPHVDAGGVVHEVADERRQGHHLAEREVEEVGDPELEREPDRAERENRGGHEAEAEAEYHLVHGKTLRERLGVSSAGEGDGMLPFPSPAARRTRGELPSWGSVRR